MSKTVLGIERIDEFKNIFENKRIGLITNPTGIDSNFKSSIDILREKTNLVGLFSHLFKQVNIYLHILMKKQESLYIVYMVHLKNHLKK